MNLEIQIQESGFNLEVLFPDNQPLSLDFGQPNKIDFEFPLSGLKGADGRSAYQVAVSNGFVGSEADWLLSLASGTPDWNLIINKPVMTDRRDFLNTNVIVFAHNMQKYPAVYIEDTGGNRWFPTTIDYPTLNDITITFDSVFSGTVYLA